MGIWNKALAIVLLAAGLVMSAAPGHAYTQSVLYPNCTGCLGDFYTSAVKWNHKLYGTGNVGSHGGGLVWAYGLSTGVYEVLYDFCASKHGSVCTDGSNPVGPLIADSAGNLYGVTAYGGDEPPYYANAGTVFELVKPATAHGAWTLVTLYVFCTGWSGSGNCADGSYPQSGLTYVGAGSGDYDGTSLLFGATRAGPGAGDPQGGGAVFALKNTGTGWSEKVVHAFCGGCGTGCTPYCGDGVFPSGQLAIDSSNRIYGTTLVGGSNNSGAAYQLSPGADPWTNPWTERVIYNFCWAATSKCLDGQTPNGVLLDAATGHLYGTTRVGGSGPASTGNGVLFMLYMQFHTCDEGSDAWFWCQTVEHNFCSQTDCADGNTPSGAIDMDGSGNVFGATVAGGSSAHQTGGAGVVWEQSGASNSTIYTFCTATGCGDGNEPQGGVLVGGTGGVIYGTTVYGGGGGGTVYGLSP
jgi:hypothetical protein